MNETFEELLVKAQMSRQGLAEELGLSPQAISRWKRKTVPGYAIAFLTERIENIRLKAVMTGIIEGEPVTEVVSESEGKAK